MNVLSRLPYFRRRDAAQRARAIARFVVAADMIPAPVALPEREVGEILAVRVDLRAVGQSRLDLGVAAAAVDGMLRFRHSDLLSKTHAAARLRRAGQS